MVNSSKGFSNILPLIISGFWLIISVAPVICQDQSQGERLTNHSSQTSATYPKLKVSENKRYLAFQNGTPFFWLGGTSWGMSEWLTREEIDFYLDDRKQKEFNLVQICLFWGKREEDPVNFTLNPTNAYGFTPFKEKSVDESPVIQVAEGGNMWAPNDYWDHLDYILHAAYQRGMMVAMLPVWGRRYVNATHQPFSEQYFSIQDMRAYGQFLGNRYKTYDHLIWVMGGDVKADDGGDFLPHYRAMAEGIIWGITGEQLKWNQPSDAWDYALMTYHPSGDPMKNSSLWFHQDPWLDFNMIETHRSRDQVYAAVAQDYQLDNPIKPTVMAEPAYEGQQPSIPSEGIHMRQQAYQSMFAGAAGFTYGGQIDAAGRGPLWTPYNGWKQMLNMEGAATLKYLKQFCLDHHWPNWIPAEDSVVINAGEGEQRKLVVWVPVKRKLLVYFPMNNPATIEGVKYFGDSQELILQWYNPTNGALSNPIHRDNTAGLGPLRPPARWNDAVLIIKENL